MTHRRGLRAPKKTAPKWAVITVALLLAAVCGAGAAVKAVNAPAKAPVVEKTGAKVTARLAAAY